MKFGNFEVPPKKAEEVNNITEESVVTDIQSNETDKNTELTNPKKPKEWFHKVLLDDEDKNLSVSEYAQKYGLSTRFASDIKKQGYRNLRDPNYISTREEIVKKKELRDKLKEVTPLHIKSLETIWGNSEEQIIVKEVINDYYSHLKYENSKGGKRFSLLDGKEITLGDLVTIDRIIDLKLFRNKNGELMMFSKKNNSFEKFNPTNFFGKHKTYTFKDNLDNIKNTNPKAKYYITPLETFAPEVFKSGFFKEEDFNKRMMGSLSYQINGPHERTLSATSPGVTFTNSVSRCLYYIGRDNFAGTNKKIKHETTKVSILDDNTGVITDIINGRKVILYTFPLINKEEYEKQKEEIIERRIVKNKSTDIKIDDYINQKAELREYKITDYISKHINESDIEYINRISKLSDTSYVLGNFRSFMSETGLAANNYSWREQLVLSDALTSVENKEKIVNFGKTFSKDGLRTFLSIEQGGKEMGDKIITLGEKLPEDVAQKVFTKYGEIIDNISKITEFTRSNFTKEIETNPELIKKIEETLYIKGKQLLSQTYDDIDSKKEINYEEIGKQLDRINADTITTFAIFKQAVKSGEKIPVESIEGSVFSKKDTRDISENQQNEMLELYESNWKNHPDREFVGSLKSYFETAFAPEDNKQKNYFYTFEKDNNIRAFVRFEKQNDASFYASALNVDEASKNFGLGEAMMDEALTREAKEHILHASCRKDNPSNMRYFEKGFIARGFKKTNETEEFDLIWDENKNKDIKAKQKSQEELISMYGNTNPVGIEVRKSKDLDSLHTDIPEGTSLVRCFVNNGEWYAVYEKAPDDYGMNLGETK